MAERSFPYPEDQRCRREKRNPAFHGKRFDAERLSPEGDDQNLSDENRSGNPEENPVLSDVVKRRCGGAECPHVE